MKCYDLNGDELSKAYALDGTELSEVYPLVSGLTFSILGDSWSAFRNYIPQGNWAYYPRLDVDEVSQMWWSIVDAETEYSLVSPNGYAGASISMNSSPSRGTRSPFLVRVDELGTSDLDLVIIMGGANDEYFDTPLGGYKYSDFTEEDLYDFRPACAALITDIQDTYPNADILWVGETITPEEYLTSVETVCEHMGIPFIYPNPAITSKHPTLAGQRTLADAVIQWIRANK